MSGDSFLVTCSTHCLRMPLRTKCRVSPAPNSCIEALHFNVVELEIEFLRKQLRLMRSEDAVLI